MVLLTKNVRGNVHGKVYFEQCIVPHGAGTGANLEGSYDGGTTPKGSEQHGRDIAAGGVDNR